MANSLRIVLLLALLALGTLLCGCPGMPGAPGGEQKMPPGVLPPPGLESGGARTLMGATITSPDDALLLVKYALADSKSPAAGEWQTCRRIIPLESCILVEGVNHDGRQEGAERDVNRLLPYAALVSFTWKYEAKLAPPEPEGESEKAEEKEGE